MPAWFNVPNAITCARLILTPVVIACVVSGRKEAALAAFVCAAVTDGLDGMLARWLNEITRLGAYLDPIADKALLSGTYLALLLASRVPLWFTALVFGRDLLILAGAAVLLAATGQRRFSPSIWGKISTLLQSACAIAVLTAGAFPALEGAAQALIWPTAAATAWSGIHYAWRAREFAAVIPSASRR